MAQFIRVKNWAEYQHYKDRSAPWIKLHREILSGHFWVMGSDASKLLAICIMLLAQRTDNKIPCDPEYIKRFGHLQTTPDLSCLIESEFIEIIDENGCLQDASNTLASCTPEENRVEERRGEREGREQVADSVNRKTSGTPKRATQLPDDFSPDDTAKNIAAELGVSISAELPKFRDYHAARGKPMKDWQAALRTWLRNAKAFARPVTVTQQKDDRRQQWLDELTGRNSNDAIDAPARLVG